MYTFTGFNISKKLFLIRKKEKLSLRMRFQVTNGIEFKFPNFKEKKII